jgi:flagellar protein FliS
LTTYSEGAGAYLKTSVETASPIDLVIMLYDSAMHQIHKGADAMKAGDRYRQNLHLCKAQRAVTELMCSLDHEKGGEIAANLMALYSFVHSRLVAANMEDDLVPLAECERVLADLRLCWTDIRSAPMPAAEAA